MKLHDLIILRYKLAKSFTKPFHDRVKDDLKTYKADPPPILDVMNIDLIESLNRRYEFTIPLVFTNHESMMASLFDRPPDIIFTQRGKDDAEKEKIVKAVYEYLKDQLNLEMFLTDAAWWYILCGFVSAHVSYEQEYMEVPILDEEGNPIVDELGQVETRIEYKKDDPALDVGDPLKEYWSPESKYSVDSSGIPYYVQEKLMRPDEVKRIYGKNVEADATIDMDSTTYDVGNKEDGKSDADRVRVIFYYGTIPTSNKGEVKEWEHDKEYGVICTYKEILYKEEMPLGEKHCRTLKWFGAPNEFFGFGIAKLLKMFQREKSMRRGQLTRYADVAAFPKLTHDINTKIDQKTARDPRENLILMYKDGQKPEYLSPPNLGQVVTQAIDYADQDAQQASGMLDISQGSQGQSVVKTATGQTIFAEAAEKRMRLAKKKLFFFYKEIVILAMKLCQQKWESEKLISITDDDGQSEQLSVTSDDFADVDFDKDIDIDYESASVNKDVLREQAIALYDKTKDDPGIDSVKLFDYAAKEGFKIVNPERFHKNTALQPGMQLLDVSTGQQFIVDEAGEVVSAETMMEQRNPGEGGQVASSQQGVASSPYVQR